jgi:hypothetical protein
MSELPSIDPILQLHRPQSAKHVIPIARKIGDRWEECAVPAFELRDWFPSFIEQFKLDSYFGINGMFAGIGRVSGKPRRSHTFKRALDVSRRANRVHTLNACFVDLDCYKVGLTPGNVMGALIDLENNGQLPPISMILLSGRGLWPFWFLRDGEHDGPAVSYARNVELWQRIQQRIVDRFSCFGADNAARDIARVTRIPGSINSKNRERVRWHIVVDAQGATYTHTLEDLARAFGVETKPARELRASNPALRCRGQLAQIHRWFNAFSMLCHLQTLRGLHPVGCRHSITYLYSAISARIARSSSRFAAEHPDALNRFPAFATMSPHDIVQLAERFALECCENPQDDPMDIKAVRAAALKATHKPLTMMRDQTIANYAKITPDESKALEHLGYNFPACSVDNIDDVEHDESDKRQARARLRREMIQRALDQLRRVPTYGELADFLEPAGLLASEATVQRDLHALGIVNPRGRAARMARRGRSMFP